ncbi:hypothetical protein A3K29_05685 [Candidatus Collierbacteria bacterium RIFOXYB2_FULL_46_14]|nr:MAG: hypothetical protein A3K29_05685 [Candidatus Collierbacteria bacterium RIFOXYB2_FULL_46_14]OGD76622.1 MAG: hypothetical protein A3K43_05685 [Candidatus Collierbacteria bacterium RIFOXYA2_FULL_46_20]OGD77958.1 MAG: hypothetical protein A3K39_05685 [Candidatus Collierbacteria bacterium RIFOXYC2_FULL_43_15]OGD82680.1 MAG: hypothetical protein A3K36_05685 [Candidatus Collierbacteria bacterium RIFOXYD2_FULL_45_13]
MVARFNQGDMYVVELVSMTPLVGEMVGDEVVLQVRNLSIDQPIFEKAVQEAFGDGEVELLSASVKVALVINAETLRDGERDLSDAAAFLEDMSTRVLDKLAATPGWGSDGLIERRSPYDQLD